VLNGPTALITSSTKHWLDQELETRLTAVNPDDSTEQTRNIFAQLSSDSERDELDLTPFRLFYDWLDLGPKKVYIENWSKSLAKMMPDYVVRFRRDYAKLLSFARVNALLNQCNREFDEEGRIVATLDDYEIGRQIMEPVIAVHLHDHASPKVLELIKTIKKLLVTKENKVDLISENNCLEISTTDLGKAMGKSQSTAHRYVTEAIGGGFIINHHAVHTKKKLNLEVINEAVPDGSSIGGLPTVEELKAQIEYDLLIDSLC
jgi:hypothetical protein